MTEGMKSSFLQTIYINNYHGNQTFSVSAKFGLIEYFLCDFLAMCSPLVLRKVNTTSHLFTQVKLPVNMGLDWYCHCQSCSVIALSACCSSPSWEHLKMVSHLAFLAMLLRGGCGLRWK